MSKEELQAEELPCTNYPAEKWSAHQMPTVENAENYDEITEKIEKILMQKIKDGDKVAQFQLGQFYYTHGQYEKSVPYFEEAAENGDWQAVFQLGVIYHDGLAGKPDHKKGFELMRMIAETTDSNAQHLIRPAQYNLGRAYFQGCGVRQSDAEAERFWLLAADDGNPKASVKAQSTLGMFYSQPDSKDLSKAFFWHSEATGNGNLESQGAMGVMYMLGLGTKKDSESAYTCLSDAAERGNVYAMGQLVGFFYRSKVYMNAVQLARRVVLMEDVNTIATETDCLPSYVAKGIAMASFYLARCFHEGRGVDKDEKEARRLYSKSYTFDADVCAKLQDKAQHGQI